LWGVYAGAEAVSAWEWFSAGIILIGVVLLIRLRWLFHTKIWYFRYRTPGGHDPERIVR